MKKKPRKRKQPIKRKRILAAKDVMNPDVITVRDDMTVQELATFLTEKEISGAPVTNERGKLVGVVSLTDIAECAAERGGVIAGERLPSFHTPGLRVRLSPQELRQMHVENPGLLVREIMTPTVYTIPGDTAVSQIAKTMISGRIHRLLVTHRSRVVGIVTTLDMLKLLVGK